MGELVQLQGRWVDRGGNQWFVEGRDATVVLLGTRQRQQHVLELRKDGRRVKLIGAGVTGMEDMRGEEGLPSMVKWSDTDIWTRFTAAGGAGNPEQYKENLTPPKNHSSSNRGKVTLDWKASQQTWGNPPEGAKPGNWYYTGERSVSVNSRGVETCRVICRAPDEPNRGPKIRAQQLQQQQQMAHRGGSPPGVPLQTTIPMIPFCTPNRAQYQQYPQQPRTASLSPLHSPSPHASPPVICVPSPGSYRRTPPPLNHCTPPRNFHSNQHPFPQRKYPANCFPAQRCVPCCVPINAAKTDERYRRGSHSEATSHASKARPVELKQLNSLPASEFAGEENDGNSDGQWSRHKTPPPTPAKSDRSPVDLHSHLETTQRQPRASPPLKFDSEPDVQLLSDSQSFHQRGPSSPRSNNNRVVIQAPLQNMVEARYSFQQLSDDSLWRNAEGSKIPVKMMKVEEESSDGSEEVRRIETRKRERKKRREVWLMEEEEERQRIEEERRRRIEDEKRRRLEEEERKKREDEEDRRRRDDERRRRDDEDRRRREEEESRRRRHDEEERTRRDREQRKLRDELDDHHRRQRLRIEQKADTDSIPLSPRPPGDARPSALSPLPELPDPIPAAMPLAYQQPQIIQVPVEVPVEVRVEVPVEVPFEVRVPVRDPQQDEENHDLSMRLQEQSLLVATLKEKVKDQQSTIDELLSACASQAVVQSSFVTQAANDAMDTVRKATQAMIKKDTAARPKRREPKPRGEADAFGGEEHKRISPPRRRATSTSPSYTPPVPKRPSSFFEAGPSPPRTPPGGARKRQPSFLETPSFLNPSSLSFPLHPALDRQEPFPLHKAQHRPKPHPPTRPPDDLPPVTTVARTIHNTVAISPDDDLFHHIHSRQPLAAVRPRAVLTAVQDAPSSRLQVRGGHAYDSNDQDEFVTADHLLEVKSPRSLLGAPADLFSPASPRHHGKAGFKLEPGMRVQVRNKLVDPWQEAIVRGVTGSGGVRAQVDGWSGASTWRYAEPLMN
ncbi:Reticulocyte-binding protein 2-like protein a [Diplonema papillatum]|nr:Reticulocyte-binding protein 2-like protein a [Diplonema papillatum]